MALSVRKMVQVGLAAALVLVGFPKALLPGAGILPLPIPTFGIFGLVMTGLLTYFSSRETRRRNLLGRVLMLTFGYMLVRGVVNSGHQHFSWYFFGREVMFILSCFAGMVIARWSSEQEWHQLAGLMVFLSGGLLATHSVLLAVAYWGKLRILDPALFSYTSAILVMLPVLLHAPGSLRAYRAHAFLGFGALSLYAALSSTRSLFLLMAFALFAISLSVLRGSRRGTLTLLKVLVPAGVILTVLFTAGAFDTVLNRLKETSFSDEVRARELEEIFAINDEWNVEGLGIGVGLDTVIAREAGHGSLVNAPHIGIFSWPIKSGLIGWFFVSVLLGTVLATVGRNIVRPTAHSAWIGLMMYVLISCVSGGWTPFELFLLGFCIGGLSPSSVTTSTRRRTESAISLDANGEAQSGLTAPKIPCQP